MEEDHNNENRLVYFTFKNLLEECLTIPLKSLNSSNIHILPSLIHITIPEEEFKTSYFTAYLQYGEYKWCMVKYKAKLYDLCEKLETRGLKIRSYENIRNIFTVSRIEILEIMYEILHKLRIHSFLLFFRISKYSFIGKKMYEDTFIVSTREIQKNYNCLSCLKCNKFHLKYFYVICKQTHILFYDYLDTKKVVNIIYIDKKIFFNIKRGPIQHKLIISDSETKYLISSILKKRVELLYESIENSYSQNEYLVNSFAPLRYNNLINFLVDGKEYFNDLCDTLVKAKTEIFIAGWWIHPKLYLKRIKKDGKLLKKYRLDNLLKKKAKDGVKIYILIYQEIGYTVNINSSYTFDVFNSLHKNVSIIRNPNNLPTGIYFWTHHEKVVIVDQKISYVGGIDLCLGRYDTKKHYLFENPGSKHKISKNILKLNFDLSDSNIWPGMDFSNPLRKDFMQIEKSDMSLIDRNKIPRMPWHDIQVKIIGSTTLDISIHFIQRWNRLTKDEFIIPREYNLRNTSLQSKCQALRSIGSWALNTNTECSIYHGYIHLIRSSKKFIYIENQFFITSSDQNTNLPENKIGLELVNRIRRAHENNEEFKVYIIIPLLPAFELDVDYKPSSVAAHIIKIQSECIYKSRYSLINKLNEYGISYKKYVMFLSLQKHQTKHNLGLFTEQIYVHSKVIICDGDKMIIGSANINDRSMLGNRDTEVSVYIEGNDVNELLKRLIHEHIKINKLHKKTRRLFEEDKLDLSKDIIYERIWKIANMNTMIYTKEFKNFLNNNIRTFKDYIECISTKHKPNLNVVKKICGNLVFYPFKFLENEEFDFNYLSLDSLISEIVYY